MPLPMHHGPTAAASSPLSRIAAIDVDGRSGAPPGVGAFDKLHRFQGNPRTRNESSSLRRRRGRIEGLFAICPIAFDRLLAFGGDQPVSKDLGLGKSRLTVFFR